MRLIASLIRYGGDFGPVGTPSDEAFCINGLVQPDRLHANPHAFEAKHAQQPVAVEPADATSLTLTEARLRVYNRYGAQMIALRSRSDRAQIAVRSSSDCAQIELSLPLSSPGLATDGTPHPPDGNPHHSHHVMATLIILIRYDFLSLDALSATWSVLEDGLPVSHEQPLAMPRVVAGGSALLGLRHTADAGAVSGAAVERLLELRFRRADGHEVIASDGP